MKRYSCTPSTATAAAVAGRPRFGPAHWLALIVLSSFAVDLAGDTADTAPDTFAATDLIDVIAVIPGNFPPQYTTDAAGRPSGFAIDVMNGIAALAGVRVNYQVRESWTDTLAALRDGQADLIPNVGITAQREADFAFTPPVETFPVSIFVRRHASKIESEDDLAGHSVAVVRANVAESLLGERPGIDLAVFGDVSEALFALLSGEVDAVVYPQPAFERIADSIGLAERIRVAGKPLIEVKRAIAVRRQDTELLARLSDAVESFLHTDAYRGIFVKWYRPPREFWTPARVGWTMGALLLAALLSMAAWRYLSVVRLNRRLIENSAERERAEEALRQANLVVENSPVVLFRWRATPGWPVELVSRNVARFGYDPEELMSGAVPYSSIVHPDDLERVVREVAEYSALDVANFRQEYRICAPDGEVHWTDDRTTIVRDDDGVITHYQGAVIDVTELREAERQLRHVQKMDAIGEMASGIAHDFNNMLGVITGNLQLLRRGLGDDDAAARRLDTIERAAQRAAGLTRQLVGFARREPANAAAVDLNDAVRHTHDLVARSLTPKIRVEYRLAEDLWPTRVDPGDFENALLNLVLNARDAMQTGGDLILETSNTTLDSGYCAQNPGATPGHYVRLCVSDTGTGIARDALERIFDPFFTTKQKGEGTGLGLAMVFGFVKRSGGHIKVYSELGVGTTFRLYLPRLAAATDAGDGAEREERPIAGGNETILAVDDEPDLLALAVELLRDLGYRVLTANDGRQAIEILEREDTVDLLFSDVVMPGGINGYELAAKATALHPELAVLLATGYGGDARVGADGERFAANVLSKPYSDVELARRVRELLDARTAGDDEGE